jgi:outer membrane protein TolC
LLNDANLELAKIKRQIPYQVLLIKYLANLDMQELVGFSGSLQEFFDRHKNTVVEEQSAENLDVLLAAQQSKIAKTQAKWQGAKYLPTINLVAGYQFNFLNNNFSNLTSKYYPTSFVGVSAKIVLFKSLNKTWALKSAVLQAKLADNMLEKTKTETDVLLFKQRMELLNSLEESNTQSANVALADLNFQNIYHQYNNGLRSSLDLLNAQETLQSASLLHVQAMYNVLMYQTLLEKTLGFTSENL